MTLTVFQVLIHWLCTDGQFSGLSSVLFMLLRWLVGTIVQVRDNEYLEFKPVCVWHFTRDVISDPYKL